MKQMKLYFLFLICLLITYACGGGDGNGGNDPQPPTPKVYSQSITLSAEGGTQNVTLSDLSSDVRNVGSTPEWLVVLPQFYSSGAPSIRLEVQANTNAVERKCNVTIQAASGDKVVLSVTQQASSNQEGTDIDDIHNNTTSQPAYSPSL